MRVDSINQIGDSMYEFTKVCPHCKEKSFFAIDKQEYEQLFIKNEYIQVVFPHLSAEEREVMISGTHPECWIEMFSYIYEEEEE